MNPTERERGQDSGRKSMFAAVHPVSYHSNSFKLLSSAQLHKTITVAITAPKTLQLYNYSHEIWKSITIMQSTFLYIIRSRSIRHALLL